MGGVLREAKLTTKSARAALPAGLHWRSIDPDIHLGYRKGKRGGRWIVRSYEGDRKYRQIALGTADDIVSQGTLSYDDAARAARKKVSDARRAATSPDDEPIPTVRQAITTYLSIRDARATAHAGRPVKSDASSNLRVHVLKASEIADKLLGEVTENELRDWRRNLPEKLKATTRERTATNFKAALNAAYRRFRKRLPPDFAEIVRLGLATPDDEVSKEPAARDNQILDDNQVRRIVAAAKHHDEDGDLGRLVLILAATGARFSQVRRMCVGDVQADQDRVMIPMSRKGRGRTPGHVTVRVGKDVLAALLPVCEGRPASEPLLCRWRYVQKTATEWVRDRRGPWTSASEMLRPWREVCEAAGVGSVVPYALRHSSIVRCIRLGLPIRLVAALHDTSVAMIERHYARWITDGLEELAAKAVVELDCAEEPLAAAA